MASDEDLFENLTFRVQGLPADYDRGAAKALVEAAARLNIDSSDVTVHSLAPSASPPREKTATITSKQLALALRPQPSQESQRWKLTISASQLPVAMERSDDAHDQTDLQVSIDTDFEGFTPLHSFEDVADHKLE
jgi:hypothetical protein